MDMLDDEGAEDLPEPAMGDALTNEEEALLLQAKVRQACEARRARGANVNVKDVARDLRVRNETINDYVTEWNVQNPPPLAVGIVNPTDQKAIDKLGRSLIRKVVEATEARLGKELFGNAKAHEEAMAAKDAEVAQALAELATAQAELKRTKGEMASTVEMLAQTQQRCADDKAASEAETERLHRENADLLAARTDLEARYREGHDLLDRLHKEFLRVSMEADQLRQKLEVLQASTGRDDDKEDPET
jgi:hypothetical protein